ncbi:MAG TPA: SRPBCC family protein [Candidatus Limnocylindria bacterium]
MPRAQNSVSIGRPPDAVFAYLLDGENCPQWRSGVLDIKRISGDGGVGTRYAQGVRGPMGRRIAADYEITACEPNQRLEFQTVTGPARPHGRYELAADDGGTRLTFSLDAELGGFKQLLMGSAVQRTMDAEVRALERLKAVLEAPA